MSLAVNGKTNINQIAVEGTNSLVGAIASAVTTSVEDFVLSSTNIIPTNVVASLPNMAAMMRTNFLPALTNWWAEVEAAGNFLKELIKAGRLPGIPKDSHGDMTASIKGFGEFQESKYPFVVTFDAALTGDSFTNHYSVVRLTKDAAWQLEKAWRTDTQGRVVVEWPAK